MKTKMRGRRTEEKRMKAVLLDSMTILRGTQLPITLFQLFVYFCAFFFLLNINRIVYRVEKRMYIIRYKAVTDHFNNAVYRAVCF